MHSTFTREYNLAFATVTYISMHFQPCTINAFLTLHYQCISNPALSTGLTSFIHSSINYRLDLNK